MSAEIITNDEIRSRGTKFASLNGKVKVNDIKYYAYCKGAFDTKDDYNQQTASLQKEFEQQGINLGKEIIENERLQKDYDELLGISEQLVMALKAYKHHYEGENISLRACTNMGGEALEAYEVLTTKNKEDMKENIINTIKDLCAKFL